MQTYHIETVVPINGTLTIKDLPFQAGDKVDIIVRSHEHEKKLHDRYPLRGKPIRYIDPLESVAESEWEVLK